MEECRSHRSEKRQFRTLAFSGEANLARCVRLWKHPVLPTRLAFVFSDGHAEVIGRMELDSVHSGQLDLRTVGVWL